MDIETRKRIRAYKRALPELRERVVAVALLLAMSASMLTSASFAWITLSRAPEATGMQTTVAANGNLEIALAQGPTSKAAVAPGESQVGDSSAAEGQSIVGANITWGNLVNISDPTYGLSQIALRPALLSTYNIKDYPLNGATYGGDGRVVTTNERYEFASYTKMASSDNYYFAAGDKANYGVRAITSVKYENVEGNARIDTYRKDTEDLFQKAQQYYKKIVADTPNDVNTLDAAAGVTCITALQGLVTVFAQDEINSMGLGNGTDTKTSCSPYLWYIYQMMLLLDNALVMEGKALLEMANWQAYAKDGQENTFATIDDLLNASSATLAAEGVKIDTLSKYKTCLNNLRTKCIAPMEPMAKNCQNPEAPTVQYYWDNISSIVDVLVTINTATINGYRLDSLNTSNAFDAIESSKNNPAPVVVKGGLLIDMEKRLVPNDCRVQADVQVTVTAGISFIKLPVTVYGTVYTEAYTTNYVPDYTNDMAYSEGLVPGAKGDAVAKDTYGIAIDLWTRTNYPNAVLTLEGAAKYEDRPAKITVEGREYPLYIITVGEGEAKTEVDVYQNGDKWYYASNMSEVASEDMGSQIPKEKLEPVVVGYEGENRVWEDWRQMLELGHIEQDATTQGGGSCFVFYADNPIEQAKIMEMLEAFNVAFMDQSGEIVGTAKLNLNSAYINQGKVTVPLEVDTGTEYTDEAGNKFTGITVLPQNTPTLLTAIVYLNGSDLKNENVLADGELQGQLNIQFGTNSTLISPKDENLQSQARTITAAVTVNGETITNGIIGDTDKNGTIGDNEGLEYKSEGYPATVTLTVDGDQPQRVSGFFVRVINDTQGTRGEEVAFTPNADGTWTGNFTLTNPGTYAFNTLLVDGVQYTLHDGTEKSGLNTYYEPNRPFVHIKGLKLTSVSVDVPAGTHMLAASSMEFPVTVKVDAAVEPKQVNAQFFNANNSKQFTAILSYDAANDQWVGSTKINSSDTYTLKYVSVDGQPLDVPTSPSYTLYLGLTARVSTDVPAANRRYIYDEEDTDGVQLEMNVQIYDDSHNPIEKQLGVELYYNNIDSPAPLTWTGSFYEGVLNATNPGDMTFNRLEIGAAGTITNVSNPPVFTALNTKPPQYVSGEVNHDKRTLIGGGTPAVATVTLSNGQTATAWAKIVNSTTGAVEYVKGAHNTNNQNAVFFNMPMTDGVWTVTKIMLQNCFDSNGMWYEDTGARPVESQEATETTPAVVGDSVEFVMSAENQARMTTDVVATYTVDVYYDQNGDSNFAADEKMTSNNPTFNLTGTPQAPEGYLFNGYAPNKLGVVIVDYAGRAVDGITGTDSNTDNKWVITYDSTTDTTYGSYDGASVAAIDAKFNLVENVTIGDKVFDSMLVSEPVTLYHSGIYTATIQVEPGVTAETLSFAPRFTIATKKPTVTIDSIAPSGQHTTFDRPNETNKTVTSSIDGNTATVHVESSRSGNNVSITTVPMVTLKLNNMGAADSATMVFSGGEHMYTNNNRTGPTSAYTWTQGTDTSTRYFGQYRQGSCSGLTYNYAGTFTSSSVTLTYGEKDYTFTVDEIKIVNTEP